MGNETTKAGYYKMDNQEKSCVTLNIKMDADTIYDSISKLISFASMLETMSKENALSGTSKLVISADVIARNEKNRQRQLTDAS